MLHKGARQADPSTCIVSAVGHGDLRELQIAYVHVPCSQNRPVPHIKLFIKRYCALPQINCLRKEINDTFGGGEQTNVYLDEGIETQTSYFFAADQRPEEGDQ